MAFVLEDGTGIAGANSYAALGFADAYFSDRGNTAWAGTDPVKEAALIRGTDYVEALHKTRWIGDEPVEPDQGLSWPRLFEGEVLVAPDFRAGVPLLLQKAVCEYALRALTGPLLPDPAIDASGFSVVTTKKKVGPIEKEFRAQGMSSQPRLIRPYPEADFLLRELLRPGQGGRVYR
jgi:hypothetical protein